MAKKTLKKKSNEEFECPHCGELFRYPVGYCYICKDHCHEVFMGHDIPPGFCTHCWQGGSKKAREWFRSRGRLKPHLFDHYSWDIAEWYDMNEAYKNETLTNLWVPNEYNIEEL